MRHFDLTPLYRTTVGFDRLFSMLDRVAGGEQNAPLGRAVIGGLLFATIATLFFVPIVFAMMRRNSASSPSPSEVNHAA